METSTNKHNRPIWIYVLNFAALTLLALTIVVAANWGLSMAFDKFSSFHSHLRADWTSNHVFTLAPSSTKLMAQIDAKNQPWEFAFFDPAIIGPDSGVTSTQVRDLLDEYAGASHMVKVRTYGSSDEDELEQKIRLHFLDEIKPYATALDHADTALKDLKTFFTQEGATLGALSAADGLDPDERALWQRMQGAYAKQVPTEIEDARKMISSQLNSTLPEYTQAVSKTRDALDMVIQILDANFVSFPKNPMFQTLSAPGKAYFTDGMKRFKDQLDKTQAVAAELSTDKLKPLALDSIKGSLQPKSVLIFAPSAVKIITPSDMVQNQRSQDPNGQPTASFAGEQAISSTILTILRPEKPKVVFVSVAPSNLVSGSYSDFAARLTAANFQVLEWSPNQDAANAIPPGIGKGVVWVVFPPPAFDMQAMQMGQMPNPGPLVAAVRRHIDLGGNALFLAEASGRAPVIPGMGDTGYAFNEITSLFGINVKSQYTIVCEQAGPNDEVQAAPMVLTHTFLPSPITDPVEGENTLFFFDRNASNQGFAVGGPAPLEISTTPPPGTTVKPLLTVNASDYWATTTPVTTATRGTGDYDAPLTLMASASRQKDSDQQRIVVIGNAQFANDQVMEAVMPTETGLELRFPGNGEITTNCVNWLAGYDNMIAVSAKANAGQRIKEMSNSKLVTLDIFMIFGVPLLLMALGGSIYVVRRR